MDTKYPLNILYLNVVHQHVDSKCGGKSGFRFQAELRNGAIVAGELTE
ncbi:MAG: hypothetical protein ACREF8_06830 [Chthoniobacterales bacterium]